MLYIFGYMVFCMAVNGNFVGLQDEILCQRSNSTLSCNHQIGSMIDGSCLVEYVSLETCPSYHAYEEFQPRNLPFNLKLYKFKSQVIQIVALNISLLQSSWKTMDIHLVNKNKPIYKICRKFKLSRKKSDLILGTPYWDCLVFTVEDFEENIYDLYVQDDKYNGGIYTFKVPSLKNYDIESTNISSWHVFFFIHEHYLERTGDIVLTLQPAPFSKISYAISLVNCLYDNNDCFHKISLETVFLNQERYEEGDASITVDFKALVSPGFYAITVQILSTECEDEHCDVSMSNVFELKRNYVVEIMLGVITIVVIIFFVSFLVMRHIHLNFYEYVKGEFKQMDSVLFVYHADSEERFILLKYLAQLFERRFYIRPLLVDGSVKTEDPNSWTRRNLCTASKVLFFVPKSFETESVTPIQHQYRCAINYFSGAYLKGNRMIANRCASVILPDSMPLTVGDEIFNLRRFRLREDLSSLMNWLHRRNLMDEFAFWRPIVNNVMEPVNAYIQFAVDPVSNRQPEFALGYQTNFLFLEKDSLLVDDLKKVKPDFYPIQDDSNPGESYEAYKEAKIRDEFDPLIPDVATVDLQNIIEGSLSDSCKESDRVSTDCESVTDVMNFAL